VSGPLSGAPPGQPAPAGAPPGQPAPARVAPGQRAPARVVIAPDKFKGSLSAEEVAAHLARGLTAAVPGTVNDEIPVADGGDGTVDAALAAGYRRIDVEVSGPTGERVTAAFALRGDVAVIEVAQACGLSRLPGGQPRPLTATSYGAGELLAAAADAGAGHVVLGLGGSATTDGGSGLISALGGRLLGAAGRPLEPGGAALAGLRELDLTGLRDLSGLDVLLASDVDNPLLGPDGAAAVYGPQKGASAADIPVLERGLARWADVTETALGGDFRHLAGAGAAGGLGFAALAFLGARMQPGIEVVLELVSFGARAAGASLVITGEGSLDEQTLRGKAPAGVALATRLASPRTPVVAVAGACTLDEASLARAGIASAYALSAVEPDLAASMANAGPLLEKLAARVAADWLSRPGDQPDRL
jgi:glycerate 2-kinase